MTPATLAVVKAARRAALDPLPAEVSTVARQCLLDWLGVALAGTSEPLVEMLVDELTSESSPPDATLVGRSRRTAASDAALINGAAAHALDYDDTHLAMMGHATVPVAAAVLALGEHREASGAQVMSALVAGVEAECRVGLLVSPSHYGRGWHATGTLGTFGAAAGCSALLELDEDAWLQAFGIAGTQASGLKAVFGTMCKPLHAGKAAAGGMLAATLAARGFTSRPDILEAHQGFAATHADRLAGPEVLEAVDGRYLIRDTLFKYHAACYLTHGAIDSALHLRDGNGLAPADVGEVEVRVAREVLDVANISEPRTGLEGKFSLRAATAMALLGDDTADPQAYSDARMAAPDLVAMRDRVRVVADSDGSPAVATATIRTTAGDELRATTDAGVPAADLAVQGERLDAKFTGLAGRAIGPRRAGELRGVVERLETLDSVAELTAACR